MNYSGNPRNKTALAPGHSLMDWIRLGASKVDLTGVGGIPQVVTMTELAKHNQRNDAWIAIRGLMSLSFQVILFLLLLIRTFFRCCIQCFKIYGFSSRWSRRIDERCWKRCYQAF